MGVHKEEQAPRFKQHWPQKKNAPAHIWLHTTHIVHQRGWGGANQELSSLSPTFPALYNPARHASYDWRNGRALRQCALFVEWRASHIDVSVFEPKHSKERPLAGGGDGSGRKKSARIEGGGTCRGAEKKNMKKSSNGKTKSSWSREGRDDAASRKSGIACSIDKWQCTVTIFLIIWTSRSETDNTDSMT